jgi:hypothetical protein
VDASSCGPDHRLLADRSIERLRIPSLRRSVQDDGLDPTPDRIPFTHDRTSATSTDDDHHHSMDA